MVGHSMVNDLHALIKLGFDWTAFPIVCLVDTYELCRVSLESILHTLQCPNAMLRSAGDDAHFTLRAALLLAARGRLLDGVTNNTLQLVEGVGRC